MTTGLVACWACGAPAGADPSWAPLRLHRCPSCGLLFAPDRGAEDLQQLYTAGYFDDYPGGEGYEEDPAQRRHEADRRIELVRRYRAGGRLLEIGAAAGHFVEAAAEAGFEPTGVEPAEALARRATERLGLPVLAGFIEEVDLPESSFDVACAWHVVEHLSDPRAALERVAAMLRPGGHLFVEVPNIASVYAQRRGKDWANLDIRHHVGHYTPRALHALLERSGFSVVATETFPMRGYLRPRRAVRPRELAAAVKEAALLRAHPRRAHPWRHEMLRAVAVTPASATHYPRPA
jgi:2-polyprenyl-3-methyl-5-hydroxy-6-metoxy-1,4-benzoquinol methylase